MLLIYYNPQKNHFYLKRINGFIFDKKVGYVNQFGHVLIQALFVYENKFISCNDFFDYCRKTKELEREQKEKNKKKNKNMLINGISHLFNKKE